MVNCLGKFIQYVSVMNLTLQCPMFKYMTRSMLEIKANVYKLIKSIFMSLSYIDHRF